jgi:hypothetical protein
MTVKTITPTDGWVKLVDDNSDKNPRTLQCRGEDPAEVGVFKDATPPTASDAGLVLYPRTIVNGLYVQAESDSVRAAPDATESIYGKANINKTVDIGIML